MIDAKELRLCLQVLDRARALNPDDPTLLQLEQASAHLRKSAKKKRKKARKKTNRANDKERVAQASIAGGSGDVTNMVLHNQRSCYVCKQPYRQVHTHYHSMCTACGDRCLAARDRRCDLTGRRALVTGGRTKIGYATALKLLRDGATVHITTRFPKDASSRYLSEPDHLQWQDRLQIQGVDFRRVPDFIACVQDWKNGPPFDILVNNAAQTVWHPPEYYRSLWKGEEEPLAESTCWISGSVHAPPKADHVTALAKQLFPLDQIDQFGNPIDLRRENSWVQHLGEISAVEMVEVQMVNSIAPFVLCNELLSNMKRSAHSNRFIVNVTAVEGQFERLKSTRHPHTNMAKAALNMLTRTSADDCAEQNIHMIAVDPGWMSHEGPHVDASAQVQTPLEATDSAARIYHPIIEGIEGNPIHGILLKDFLPQPW